MNKEEREIRCDEITNSVMNDIDALIKSSIAKLDEQRVLHIISLSNDAASASYMKNKVAMGARYGIEVKIHKPRYKGELIDILNKLNKDSRNRIIIQCPFNEDDWGRLSELLHYIPDYMDVDGSKFNLLNLNKIQNLDQTLLYPTFSPTAKGVISLINKAYEGLDMKGTRVTVLGKGLTSGLPIALICEQLGYTVSWCNSRTPVQTRNNHIKDSKIVISCVGKEMINKENKSDFEDACYINIGMFRDEEDGKLKGDINYNEIIELENTLYCNRLFNSTGRLTTMCLILNTVL